MHIIEKKVIKNIFILNLRRYVDNVIGVDNMFYAVLKTIVVQFLHRYHSNGLKIRTPYIICERGTDIFIDINLVVVKVSYIAICRRKPTKTTRTLQIIECG